MSDRQEAVGISSDLVCKQRKELWEISLTSGLALQEESLET